MIRMLYDIIYIIIEVYLFILFFNYCKYKKSRYAISKHIVPAIIVFCVLVLKNTLMYQEEFNTVIFVIKYLVFIYILEILYCGDRIKRYIYLMLFVLLVSFIDVIINSICLVFFRVVANGSISIFHIDYVVFIVSRILFLIFIKYFFSYYQSVFQIKITQIRTIMIILTTSIIFTLCVLHIFLDGINTSGNILAYITFSILIFTTCSIFTVFIVLQAVKYSVKEKQLLLAQSMYDQQLKYVQNLQKTIQEIRRQKHDFNNHIEAIHSLIQAGEYAQVEKYTSNLIEDAVKLNNFVSVGHSGIDALLNYKLSHAVEKGIKITTHINVMVKPEIEPNDLTIVIGNILDNAIEACELIDKGNRYIDIKVYNKRNYFVIEVENSKNNTKKSRSNIGEHGIGLKNVKYVVQKYCGYMNISETDINYQIKIALLGMAK